MEGGGTWIAISEFDRTGGGGSFFVLKARRASLNLSLEGRARCKLVYVCGCRVWMSG
jgi:hypothetical protein